MILAGKYVFVYTCFYTKNVQPSPIHEMNTRDNMKKAIKEKYEI